MLEWCRFAYKAYAQTCVYPIDPFYESRGKGTQARDGMMAQIHKHRKSVDRCRELDPVLYRLDAAPNPRHGVVYRGGTGDEPYILFQPRPLDLDISSAMGVDLLGNAVASSLAKDADGYRCCCHFQGSTGMTQNKPGLAWTTWLGAVIYDTLTQRVVVVFRGSRSGDGGRALKQALLHSKGNADWVSDMNHLKPIEVPRFGNATLATGFWQAYQSCKVSLAAAFVQARSGSADQVDLLHRPQSGRRAGAVRLHRLPRGRWLPRLGGRRLHDEDDGAYLLLCHLRPRDRPLAMSLARRSSRNIPPRRRKRRRASTIISRRRTPCTAARRSASRLHRSRARPWPRSTHPATAACHLGTEASPQSTASFPAAHEPEAVREASSTRSPKDKCELPPDPTFWPLLGLDVTSRAAPKLVVGACSMADTLSALSNSTSAKVALHWRSSRGRPRPRNPRPARSPPAKRSRIVSCRACSALPPAQGRTCWSTAHSSIFDGLRLILTELDQKNHSAAKTALLAHRVRLLDLDSQSSSAARSASIFVLLQYLAALYFWFDGHG